MDERSPKCSPMETIQYEIDMFRHCAETLGMKYVASETSGGHSAKAEYYLGIEGALLHLRNLLGFFIPNEKRDRKTDLVIDNGWANREVEKSELADLIQRAEDVNRIYGMNERTCYDQISKFLQHCTTFRHLEARSWNIEKMLKAMNPILEDFEKRFNHGSQRRSQLRVTTVLSGIDGNSTATLERGPRMIFEEPLD